MSKSRRVQRPARREAHIVLSDDTSSQPVTVTAHGGSDLESMIVVVARGTHASCFRVNRRDCIKLATKFSDMARLLR